MLRSSLLNFFLILSISSIFYASLPGPLIRLAYTFLPPLPPLDFLRLLVLHARFDLYLFTTLFLSLRQSCFLQILYPLYDIRRHSMFRSYDAAEKFVIDKMKTTNVHCRTSPRNVGER